MKHTHMRARIETQSVVCPSHRIILPSQSLSIKMCKLSFSRERKRESDQAN